MIKMTDGSFFISSCFQDDGWDTEPFTLVEKDGKLFGRGSTDDKVQILFLYAFMRLNFDLALYFYGQPGLSHETEGRMAVIVAFFPNVLSMAHT